MVHKNLKKRSWFKRHLDDIRFLEGEGLLFAGAGAVAYGIANGSIPPSMGEPLVMAVATGTALNVMRRSEKYK